jgi:hypothetical protein
MPRPLFPRQPSFAISASASRLLKNPVFVIARRAKPGVAIQPFIDLDCFASLAMTILAGFLSLSAAC